MLVLIPKELEKVFNFDDKKISQTDLKIVNNFKYEQIRKYSANEAVNEELNMGNPENLVYDLIEKNFSDISLSARSKAVLVSRITHGEESPAKMIQKLYISLKDEKTKNPELSADEFIIKFYTSEE